MINKSRIQSILQQTLLRGLLVLIMQTALFTHTYSADTIQLDITTHLGDTQRFKQGDTVSFLVSMNKDAYLLMVYEDASSTRHILLPNALQSSNFYKAGIYFSIPNSEQPFQFIVGPPYGHETVWLFASDLPLPELKTLTAKTTTFTLSLPVKTIRDKLISHAKRHNAAFGEAKLVLETYK